MGWNIKKGGEREMTSEEFEDLCQNRADYVQVEQEDVDKITIEEIDKISGFKVFDKIRISGLTQDTFDYFIHTQGYKFNAIMFWHNKLIKDWSALSTLKNVKFIGYYHNQKIEQLWDMSENYMLEGLYISDFTRLKTLKGIEKAPRLERLSYGNAIWNTSILDDLNVLEKTKLKEFCFARKKITEEDLTIYTRMPHLEILDFPTNLYTTEQLAWLVAKLPHVKGYALRPYVEFDDDDEKDVLICGKRKPFLSSKEDAAKVKAYVYEFEKLVEEYRK